MDLHHFDYNMDQPYNPRYKVYKYMSYVIRNGTIYVSFHKRLF